MLCIVALEALVGAVHARLYGHDIFFLLDNGWRALHGQRVHVDYVSAWGPLTFLLVAAGLIVSNGSVAAVTYASALFAAIVGAWSVWLVSERARGIGAVVFPCFIALIAAAPFAIGDPPTLTSQAMVYNRYGYALLMLIMLESFLPASEDGEPHWRKSAQPALTGCALGLLLFLKISFFLIAVPLLGMSLIFQKDRWPRLLAHVFGFAVIAFCFLGYLHFDVVAMVADLRVAGAVRSGTLGIGRDGTELLIQGVLRASALAAAALLCRRWNNPQACSHSLWRGWFYPLTAIVIVIADTLLLLTNAQVLSYPLTAAYSVILGISAGSIWRAGGTRNAAKTSCAFGCRHKLACGSNDLHAVLGFSLRASPVENKSRATRGAQI